MGAIKRRGADKQLHILLRVGFRTGALLSLIVAAAVAPSWVFGKYGEEVRNGRRLSENSDDDHHRLSCYDFQVDDFDPYCEYSNYGSFPGTTLEPRDSEMVNVITVGGHDTEQCAIKDCKIDGDYYLCQYTLIKNSTTDENVQVAKIGTNETFDLYNTVAYMPPVSPFTTYGLLCYIIGLVYMFLGLAIVCDEFFVPALEEIVERTGMTEDVAGATLMAAGGSAPELFTSILGTFVTKSSVGFGTIVGSAVFNVLFVIGMCAIFSKEELTLTMWPLFRDSTYYLFSLLAVAVFFSVISPGEIYWWEALILLMLYALYVVVMKYNKNLHSLFNRTFSKKKKPSEAAKIAPASEEEVKSKLAEDAVTGVELSESKQEKPKKQKERQQSITAEMMKKVVSPSANGSGQRQMMARARQKTIRSLHTSHDEQPTFRAGVLHFMKTHKFEVDNLRVHVVAELPGGIKETFDKLDTNGDGNIDKHEMGVLLMNLLKRLPDDNEVIQTIREIGPKGPEVVSFDEFEAWYAESESRLEVTMLTAFKSMDDNDDDHVDKQQVSTLLKRLIGEDPSSEMVRCAMKEFDKENDGFVTLEEFRNWYKKSMLYQSQVKTTALEEEEEEGLDPWPPYKSGFKAMALWFITLPIVGPLWLTVPDVRKESRKNFFPLTWILSIMWIAFYSYFMVWWATLVGDRFGVPPVVMGLTFLAAGTSIPDLLTSVIVARQGLGDMAVSSSIGSNIFDVLIGLPIPWLIHGIAIGPFKVGAENLEISILVLCAMLFILVLSIHISGWKMSKPLGYAMFFFYGIFVAQDLWQQKNLGCL